MELLIIISFVFVCIFSIILLILLILRRASDPTVKHIKELQHTTSTYNPIVKSMDTNKQKEKLHEKVRNLLTNVSRLTKQDEKKISKIRERLIQAGYHREETTKIFMGLRIISAIGFSLIIVYLGLLGNQTLQSIVMLSSIVAGVGYLFPNAILNFKIRKRQDQIAGGLPDALDLLVITVEAGLGLNAALSRVGDDLALRCPALSEEMARVNHDIRTGVSREEALRNLSNRNQIEDLKILVGSLILADRLGSSIADTLRAQSDSLRTRIRQKAEEQGARAAIKMLFPLVLFILPALIIIMMGPGIITVYRTFSP